jgi:hypothetical protein
VGSQLPVRRTLLSIGRNPRSPTKGAEMFSTAYKTRLATALAGAALASALAVSGASADQHAIDAHNRAVNPPPVASPQELRSSNTREQPEVYSPALASQAVADEPSSPGGFDWVSAAIGAAAAAGLSLVLMATLGLRRPTSRGAASA